MAVIQRRAAIGLDATAAPMMRCERDDHRAIDALLGVREPYGLIDPADEAMFAAAMAAADTWHRARNPAYDRLWRGARRPLVPVGLLKAVDLSTSLPADDGEWLTSTGTSGGARTRVLFDRRSMARIGVGMLQIFLHARLFDVRPARFLLLCPDPTRSAQPGYATAFREFTACAPVAERIHAVADDGTFLADVAWEALRRWSRDEGAIFIFGLTVYFERLVLSAPGPAPQRDRVLALTGGGWKGMERRLSRPEMVDGLRALLAAPVCDVRDLFGLTEHPLHYISCPAGRFHIPKYSRVHVITAADLDNDDNRADRGAARLGTPGLIRLQNPFFASFPGHDLLTEDLGQLDDECPCGVHSLNLRFLGRATAPTGTCAASAAEALG